MIRLASISAALVAVAAVAMPLLAAAAQVVS